MPAEPLPRTLAADAGWSLPLPLPRALGLWLRMLAEPVPGTLAANAS